MTTPNEELILKLRGQAYTTCRPDQLCDQAADLLQSQAERIKELESEVEMWKATANAVVDFEKVQLRAEIAAIAATEPVAYRWVWKSKPWDIEGWCYTNTPPTLPELQEIEPLFTRPMPAQGVEASMIELPEPDDTYCGVNYYTESQLKQAVSDALDAELVKDAKRMAQQGGLAEQMVSNTAMDYQLRALDICREAKKVSVSLVQRKLGLSYAAAQELCQSIVASGLVPGLPMAPSLIDVMAAAAQPEDGCAPNHICNGHRVHIPTGECCNKCGATSW